MGGSIIGDRLRAQGDLARSRIWLLDLLRAKYPGSVSAEVTRFVEQQTDLALLNQWFQSALQKNTFAEFVKTLK